MPQCANLTYSLVAAFVCGGGGGITNRPEDQATRCSLGSAELTGATGDSSLPTSGPQHPEFPSQGSAQAGDLIALSIPNQLFLVPTPNHRSCPLSIPPQGMRERGGSSPAGSSKTSPPSTGKSVPDYWGGVHGREWRMSETHVDSLK